VKFSKCVTLQHCSKQTEGLSFVRASCRQEQLPYTFESVETGVFSEQSSHGSIELSRFSGYGIGNKSSSSPKLSYCAQAYYSSVDDNTHNVYFVITKNLKAHINVSHAIKCLHNNNQPFPYYFIDTDCPQ